jgi:hypothetical protein
MTKRNRNRRANTARHHDARVVLRSEFEAVASLFDEFENSRSAARKKAIVEQICLALTVHTQLEDEILHPAVKKALNKKRPASRARERRAILRGLIAEVQGSEPGTAGYNADVKLMSEQVRRHADRQGEVLPRKCASKLDLDELGTRLMSRKREILAAMVDFGGWD